MRALNSPYQSFNAWSQSLASLINQDYPTWFPLSYQGFLNYNQPAADQSQRIATLNRQLAGQHRQIVDQHRKLADQDQIIADQDQEIDDQDQEIADLNEKIDDLNEKVADQHRQIQELLQKNANPNRQNEDDNQLTILTSRIQRLEIQMAANARAPNSHNRAWTAPKYPNIYHGLFY